MQIGKLQRIQLNMQDTALANDAQVALLLGPARLLKSNIGRIEAPALILSAPLKTACQLLNIQRLRLGALLMRQLEILQVKPPQQLFHRPCLPATP